MTPLRLALFDVDGVLLDSLTPHLLICRDKAREYGLNLRIPEPAEFKEMVRKGVVVSPMIEFFRAVGFPESFAQRAYRDYQCSFMRDYAPTPFPGAIDRVREAHELGIELGIVTSNFRANVDQALAGCMPYFRESCIFTKDTKAGATKALAIQTAIAILSISPSEAIYIGDQLGDWKAAHAAGVDFLGVSYGWGISESDNEFPVSSNLDGVISYLADRRLH